MATRAPRSSSTPEPKPAPAARRTSAAKAASAQASVATPPVSTPDAAEQVPQAAATSAPVTTAPAAAAPASQPPVSQPPVSPSVLERLRRNRMGAVLGGLLVALAVGMLLSIFVPDSNLLLALAILGLAEAFAVGFTVRYLTECRGLATQVTAFVLAALGTHVLVTTGMVNQAIGDLSSSLGDLLGGSSAGASDFGWDDSLIAALATPSVSTGAIVCGLVAAIIAGWGARPERHHRDAAAS